jgi:two-component system, chemotaxis family, protein-glutamate methylesterase/glutaminase
VAAGAGGDVAPQGSYGIVVIGASWGGLHAIGEIVAGLPVDFAAPLAVVQHRSRESDHLLGDLLQDRTPLTVREVDDKEPILPGHVYVAPPDYHMLVDGPYFSLTVDAPVRYSRPSIDVTFTSAADSYGDRVIGVVLTGANEDGAAGLARIVALGGYPIVQDPATAEVRTMPVSAQRAVPGAEVLPLDGIAARLVALCGRASHPAQPAAQQAARVGMRSRIARAARGRNP